MSANCTSLPQIVDKPYQILQASVHGFIIIFGTLANAIVILTYLKWRRNMFETSRDLVIFTLATADCVISILVAPFGLASSVSGRWSSGRGGCVWYGFVSTWMGLASILQLAGIAAERYFTLCHPNLRWSHSYKQYTRLFIVFAWIISGITATLPLFGWSKYDFEGSGLYCSIVWSASTLNYGSYSLFLLIFYFLIPLSLIIYFYTKVYFAVRLLSSEAVSLWGVRDMATKKSYIAQVKVARQLVILTAMFLFAWTPYAVMSFLSVTNLVKLDGETSLLPALFAKMSNVYNPLVYFFTFRRLRRKSFELFTRPAKH